MGCYELCKRSTDRSDMKPASYWKNTSDNAIIRSFIDYAGSGIQKKDGKIDGRRHD